MAFQHPSHGSGTMLALWIDPDVAADLAVDGGEPPDQLHVTVAYTGKADQVDRDRLHAAAQRVLNREPIDARISGHARFTGNPDGDVIVALVDSPALERLRRDVVDALTAEGVDLPAEHGYTAHITLAYVDPGDPDPVGRLEGPQIAFSRLEVVHGTGHASLPFRVLETATGPGASVFETTLAGLAREAYAQGWAASGGPMTDRVKAGCVAAVHMALDHADQPGILEATLRLGHLEGVWARVFDRRLKLHADQDASIVKQWRTLVDSLDVTDAIRTLRHLAGLSEAADSGFRQLVADAVGLILGLLRGRQRDPQWQVLRQTVRDALAAAQAEGVVDALALAADQLQQIGFDYELAFEDAYQALENLDELWAEADEWLARTVDGVAKQLGETLARMARDGTSRDEMIAAAENLLEGVEQRAVSVVVDWAISQAMSAGAIALYQREGVDLVDFVTAGDQRVCPQCADAEQGSPYRLADCPQPGLHPECRCVVYARDPLPLAAVSPYIPKEG